MTNATPRVFYIVRSAINPKMVLCTDGQFYAEGVHTGPGTGHAIYPYKLRRNAELYRQGVGTIVEEVRG